MLSRRKFLQVTIAGATSLLIPSLGSKGFAQEARESRAIFDESLSWITETAAHNVCQRIKHAGFNVLMPNVWHGRGTAWPSRLAPWDSDRLEGMARDNSVFDPLGKLIEIAAQYQIEVHPWFNVMLRQRKFFQQYYEPGTPADCFDVHNPAFRILICDLMIECLSRYPVHGINIDFIRSCSICQSQSCVQNYRDLTGRNLSMDRLSYGISSEARNAIAHWNGQAVEDIVQRVANYVRKNRPDILTSVCASPGNPNLYIQGQDSIKWADEGLVDVIYAMHYGAELNWKEIRAVQKTMKRPDAYVVLCGNYDSVGPKRVSVSREAAKVSAQISQSRQIGQANGVGLYLYSLLNDEQIDALRAGPFRVPAKPKWTRAGTTALSSPNGGFGARLS